MKLKLLACLIAAPLFAPNAPAHADDLFVKEVSTGAGQASGSLLLPVNASAQNYKWINERNSGYQRTVAFG